MTAPRIVVPGATLALTRRTAFRKAFLAPWHPLVRDIWLYSLADAQRTTGVAVHHGVLVLNHEHLQVTPSSDNLPIFVQRLHHDVSCALNTLLARERYDAPGTLWDGREPHCMRLLDAEAQASQLVYQHVNCVAAGLVERPEQMPDHAFDFGLWRSGVLEVHRPPVFFGKDRPAVLRLEVTPPPLLYEAFGGDLDALAHHMKRMSEGAIGALRAVRRRPPVGARAVRRLHPWIEPRTLREPGGRRVPTFRVGAAGLVDGELEHAAALETTLYRRVQREARLARRSGDLARPFPLGTYAMRVQHNVPIDPMPLGATVTQPGPLLCDLRAQSSEQRLVPSARRERVHALVDAVNQAFRDEAAAVVDAEALTLDSATRGAGGGPDAEGAEDASASARPARQAHVRHRFDRGEADLNAARVVVLRDRRRGRRPGKRHAADPPG